MPAQPILPQDMQQAQALHTLLLSPRLKVTYVSKLSELTTMFNSRPSSAQQPENFTMQMAEALNSIPTVGIQTLPAQTAGQMPSSAVTHNTSVHPPSYTNDNY